MARSKTKGELPAGLEDRRPSCVIRARLRARDAKGVLHNLRESWPYDDEAPAASTRSRKSAIVAATAWLEEQRRAMRFDGTPAGTRLRDQTLGGWIQRYIDEAEEALVELAAAKAAGEEGKQRVAQKSLPAYTRKKGLSRELSTLRQWMAEFPKLMARTPDEVTQDHIISARDWLRHERKHVDGSPATLVPDTINRWVDVLSAVYNTARVSWKFQVTNPVKGIPKLKAEAPHEEAREGRVVTHAELDQVLAHIPEATLETRCCIKFLRWCGGRRSEAIRLDWSDVDFDKPIPEVTFRDTKDPLGRKPKRTIPLHHRAVDALNELLEGRPKPVKGKVFSIGIDTPTRAFIRGRDRAGLDVRLHDLRHTRTTEVTTELPVHEAQQITGHKDARMLMRYYHPDIQQLGAKLSKAEAERATAAINKKRKDEGQGPLSTEDLQALFKMFVETIKST